MLTRQITEADLALFAMVAEYPEGVQTTALAKRIDRSVSLTSDRLAKLRRAGMTALTGMGCRGRHCLPEHLDAARAAVAAELRFSERRRLDQAIRSRDSKRKKRAEERRAAPRPEPAVWDRRPRYPSVWHMAQGIAV